MIACDDIHADSMEFSGRDIGLDAEDSVMICSSASKTNASHGDGYSLVRSNKSFLDSGRNKNKNRISKLRTERDQVVITTDDATEI